MSFLDDATLAATFARYFNATEYMEAKAAQLNSLGADNRTDWSVADVANLFQQAGLTAAQYYQAFGARETDAQGYLVNPSNAFDANAYAVSLLAALAATDGATWAGKTAMDVVNAIADAGLSLVDHYQQYGAALANATGISLAQTVPVAQRVANDPERTVNVPGNYNKAVDAPGSVVMEHAASDTVHKPCDMGSMSALINYDLGLIASPGEAVPTPYDDDYVPIPGGGILDTNDNPVVLVRQTVTDSDGNIVASIAEYGVRSVVDGTIVVQAVDANGTVRSDATPLQTISSEGIRTVLHTADGQDIVQDVSNSGETHYTDTSGNAVVDPSVAPQPEPEP